MSAPMHDLVVRQRAQLASERLAERLGRAQWLVAHPDWPTGHAPDGEQAEYRHLLYDADPDAATPAFDYPNPEATQ
ncbi:hypothetical protein [Streptomyces sp. NPDC003877]